MHFSFAIMMSTSYGYFCHLLAMSIKTTPHARAPLLYLCRRYPKFPCGLYASSPPEKRNLHHKKKGELRLFPQLSYIFQSTLKSSFDEA